MKDLYREYISSTPEKRVDIVLNNYNRFLKMVNSITEGILFMLREEMESNIRASRGENVGGRSSNISDPTYVKAVKSVILRDAFIECDFSSGILDFTDHPSFFEERAEGLSRMRKDYGLVESMVNDLEDDEKELFFSIMVNKKKIQDIADENLLSYNAIYSRLFRIKATVKENTLLYYEGKILLEEEDEDDE